MSPNEYLIFLAGFYALAFGLNWLHNTIIKRKQAKRRNPRDSTN